MYFTKINNEAFTSPWYPVYGHLFIGLIFEAYRNDKIGYIGSSDNPKHKGNITTIKRGQVPYSIDYLRKKYNMTWKTYDNFLHNMADLGEIEYIKHNTGTLITLLRYDYWTCANSEKFENTKGKRELSVPSTVNIEDSKENKPKKRQKGKREINGSKTGTKRKLNGGETEAKREQNGRETGADSIDGIDSIDREKEEGRKKEGNNNNSAKPIIVSSDQCLGITKYWNYLIRVNGYPKTKIESLSEENLKNISDIINDKQIERQNIPRILFEYLIITAKHKSFKIECLKKIKTVLKEFECNNLNEIEYKSSLNGFREQEKNYDS